MIFGEQRPKVIDWDILSGAYEQQYTTLQKDKKTEKLPDPEFLYISQPTRLPVNTPV